MHVDLHGKRNGKVMQEIDIGMMPMETEWADKSFVSAFKHRLATELERALENTIFSVSQHPIFCGRWTVPVHTMTHQAVQLRITSVQLELPRCFRERLMRDGKLFDKFSRAIANTYKQFAA